MQLHTSQILLEFVQRFSLPQALFYSVSTYQAFLHFGLVSLISLGLFGLELLIGSGFVSCGLSSFIEIILVNALGASWIYGLRNRRAVHGS